MRKKENVYNRTYEQLTPKENTRDWRIGFAAVNIVDISKYNQMRGGVAFYNQNSANALFNSGTVPVSWDFVNLLNQYHIPVTVVNGDYDYVDFTAFSDEQLLKMNAAYLEKNKLNIIALRKYYSWKDFTTVIPTLRLHIIKNAGHSGWIDAPEEYRTQLLSGLSR